MSLGGCAADGAPLACGVGNAVQAPPLQTCAPALSRVVFEAACLPRLSVVRADPSAAAMPLQLRVHAVVRSPLISHSPLYSRRSSALALAAGCAASGAAAFVQPAGHARLFNSVPSAAGRAPLRPSVSGPVSGASLRKAKRQARLSGIARPKMVANVGVSTDFRNTPIMDKFEIVKEDTVEEYGSKVVLFRHKKTGAEIMSVSVPDENKCFGITFRTVRLPLCSTPRHAHMARAYGTRIASVCVCMHTCSAQGKHGLAMLLVHF